MRRNRAEQYRDIDFSKGKRGTVIPPAPRKTKISIRLDNAVLDHFRALVEAAGGGNDQSLINDALVSHIALSERSVEFFKRESIRACRATFHRSARRASGR
jgi:uncharacterized protein (DUF4415 family)